jgi:hypothetical protein
MQTLFSLHSDLSNNDYFIKIILQGVDLYTGSFANLKELFNLAMAGSIILMIIVIPFLYLIYQMLMIRYEENTLKVEIKKEK